MNLAGLPRPDASGIVFCILCCGLVAVPDMAWAAANPIEQAFCTANGWFSGPLGTAIETISVVVFGILALLGKVSWSMMLIDAAGASALHGAAVIAGVLGGGFPAGC